MFIFDNLEWVLFMITGLLVFTTPWRGDSSVSKSSLNCLFYPRIIDLVAVLCWNSGSWCLSEFATISSSSSIFDPRMTKEAVIPCVIVESFTKTRNCIRGIKTDIDSDFRFTFVVCWETQMMLCVLFTKFCFLLNFTSIQTLLVDWLRELI